MVQESSISEKNFIFLIQTKNRDLEHLLSNAVEKENIRFESVERPGELREQQPEGQIITFIIGSDVEDPIQSAQRFHAFKKSAKIILLSKSENVESLKEAIKFSPFIGVDVICLDESKKAELGKNINEILDNSLRAEKYRDIIAESNPKISLEVSSRTPAFNQNFINKLMDIAPIGIAIVGRKGKVLGWNKEAALIFKKSESRVLGTPLSRLFEHAEGKKLEDYLRESFEKRKTGPIESLSLERESQETSGQVLSFTAAPFTYSGGTEKALILTVKDVTERRQAKKELQEMNITLEERVEERTKSLLSYQDQLRSLASQLSKAEEHERQRLASELHDNLGQMLAVGKMKIDLLQKGQFSDQASSDIDELKEVMEDALTYTRDLMTELKPPPMLDEENLPAKIEWVAKKMKKHDLEVIIEDDKHPKPLSKEVQTTLLQCVRELLFNVVRHTSVREAYVSLKRSNSQIKVTVEDRGSGFETENIKSAPADEGGFGLFNIQERVDMLGGEVDIHSEPGVGTRATLYIPLKERDSMETVPSEKPEKAERSEKPEEAEKAERIKILLADDHQMVREGLRKIIEEEEDMTVIGEAADGEEAVKITRNTSPDIILMDVNMPKMDGIEATKKILSEMPRIRIIGLSLHGDEGVIRDMRNVGATAYLTKNEAFESLVASIRAEASAPQE